MTLLVRDITVQGVNSLDRFSDKIANSFTKACKIEKELSAGIPDRKQTPHACSPVFRACNTESVSRMSPGLLG